MMVDRHEAKAGGSISKELEERNCFETIFAKKTNKNVLGSWTKKKGLAGVCRNDDCLLGDGR